MYFCTVNGNNKAMICTLSSAHWQPCGALNRFGKIGVNTPINTIIIIIKKNKKKGIKSLGQIRATGKEVKGNHYVLHLTPILQLAITVLSFGIRAGFKYHIELQIGYSHTAPIIIPKMINSIYIPFCQSGSQIRTVVLVVVFP